MSKNQTGDTTPKNAAKIKRLSKNNKSNDISLSDQGHLFQAEVQIESNDIEMGVLENGIPYLSERGLAQACGIDKKTLSDISLDWENQKLKPRGKKIAELLAKNEYYENELFIRAEYKGSEIKAYIEPVCIAVLEYYAFEAPDEKDHARNSFRAIARHGLRRFVYEATSYQPEHWAIDSWKHFHDRVNLTTKAVPAGYFGVFTEIAGMIVPMIEAGIIISDKVIPDISVGITWGNYWKDNGFSEKYGEPIKYSHSYPDYYPQAESNPQSVSAYPEAALGEFRAWLRGTYIQKKLPDYMLKQVKKESILGSTADTAIKALGGDGLPDKTKKIKN